MTTIPPMSLISIHSYKGGVGKSTMAVLLGLALAERARVCLVDLDFLAPGLHHLLGKHELPSSLLNFLVADPANPRDPTDLHTLCQPIDQAMPGAPTLHLLPSRPDFAQAKLAQGYLLADARAGLVRARLGSLLQQVQEERIRAGSAPFDLFMLDTPPSLFGVSAAVHTLVTAHHGAQVYVANPLYQDIWGCYSMLFERFKADTTTLKAFVFNRCAEVTGPLTARDQVLAQITEAMGKGSDRTWRDLFGRWLDAYEVAQVPYLEEIGGLAGIALPGTSPTYPDVLPASLRELAGTLLGKLGVGVPA